jgi:hypothetical protein
MLCGVLSWPAVCQCCLHRHRGPGERLLESPEFHDHGQGISGKENCSPNLEEAAQPPSIVAEILRGPITGNNMSLSFSLSSSTHRTDRPCESSTGAPTQVRRPWPPPHGPYTPSSVWVVEGEWGRCIVAVDSYIDDGDRSHLITFQWLNLWWNCPNYSNLSA